MRGFSPLNTRPYVSTTRSKPQYAIVADALIRDIANETYPVGSLLPPELELADRFGVSRNTMRTAMRVLVDMGLVSRRAGMGTLVQTRQATPNFLQSVASLDELFPDIGDTEIRVVQSRQVTADAALAQLLACNPGDRWQHLECVRQPRRRRGGAPLSFSHVYVAAGVQRVADLLDKHAGPAFQVIEKSSEQPVTEVVQQSDAAAMPADAAKHLDVAAGSAALRTVRRYALEDSRVVMVTDTYSAPGRRGFTVRLRSGWGDSDA